jgi:hypothetical protein
MLELYVNLSDQRRIDHPSNSCCNNKLLLSPNFFRLP